MKPSVYGQLIDARRRLKRIAGLLRQLPELDDPEYIPVQALKLCDLRRKLPPVRDYRRRDGPEAIRG